MRRPFLLLLFLVFGIILPASLAVWLAYDAVPGKFKLKKTEFDQLPGWQEDDRSSALQAFLKSCKTLNTRTSKANLPGIDPATLKAAFVSVCEKAGDDPQPNFFEENFEVYQLSVGRNKDGFLTGYYEPLLEASLEAHSDYPVALYRKPEDQVSIDLGSFRESLEGTQLVGRLDGSRLVPYHSREDIGAGALENRGLELLWAKDPVNAFFLQIQGSGRARLPDGTIIRIGYGGKNGHPYTAIGGVLANEGHLELDEVSLRTIRQWLDDNPDQMHDILNRNASYVFFRLLEEDGPIGSAGAVLTAERSLAVDPRFIPLGLPVWISGEMPDPDNPETEALPLLKLLIAQDTGGAIKGELRGDVFWGFGERAEILAGHMKHEAEFFLLLPKGVSPEGSN